MKLGIKVMNVLEKSMITSPESLFLLKIREIRIIKKVKEIQVEFWYATKYIATKTLLLWTKHQKT